MKCTKCGAELPEGTKHCSYCGEKIKTDKPEGIAASESTKETATHSTVHKLPEAPSTGKKTTAINNGEKRTLSQKTVGYGKIAAIGLVIFIILCLVVHVVKTKLDDRSVSDQNGMTSDESLEELGTLEWPDSEMAKLIPTPKSTIGEIFQDDNSTFSAIIGDTALDDYHTYVQKCIEKGFDIETDQGGSDFFAMNTDGYKLTVKHMEPNRMQIDMEEPEYEINIEVNCNKNLIFSKYDVEIFVDDISEGVLEHGGKDTYSTILNRGTHTIRFVNEEDDTVDGTVKIKVRKNKTFNFEITCSNSQIDVINLADEAKTEKNKADENKKNVEKQDETKDSEEESEEIGTAENSEVVSYSTNTYEAAKQGNTGVFSYKSDGGSYDLYWIVDFDEGYVYNFAEGDIEPFCDRLKIDSGTLNDNVIITYHDGEDTWSYSLHFKYINNPETLIMVDNDGFEYKYSATNLADALKLREALPITDF